MTVFRNPNQLNQVLMRNDRLLALDVGAKRIGVAISDESRSIATPKLIINRQSNQKDFTKIAEILGETRAAGIIVGMPCKDDGSPDSASELITKFTENLDEFLEQKLPIIFFDERLSSFEARSFNISPLSRKKNKFYDDIAASLILQHFLDQSASE